MTGGAGFIGSNLTRFLIKNSTYRVVVLDKLTYAGNLLSLEDVSNDSRYQFVQADIADASAVAKVFSDTQPVGVFNLAAETHVDRSIDGPTPFIQTNVVGTFTLLETIRSYLKEKDKQIQNQFRFLHVSTDEVYGSLGETGSFTEETPYSPNSPYSASKAAADHLVQAYYTTYHLPVLITNCSNNYGPYQFPEKLIPLMVLNAREAKSLPVYGDGKNVRDWLFVEDHCAGLFLVFQKGRLGEKYNIGGDNEWTNIEIVKKLSEIMEKALPAEKNTFMNEKKFKNYSDLISFVKDRPGHDRRYAIDATKIRKELGWKAKFNFQTGLEKTLNWYLEKKSWCESVQNGQPRRERLGLKAQ